MGFFSELQRSPLVNLKWRNRLLRCGGVRVEEMVRVRPRCHLGDKVTIGKGTFINYGCFFDDLAPIALGEWCLIAQEVIFCTSYHDHHDADDRRLLSSKPIRVGDHAWIGARAVILPGVTVGEHAIIGAGAVVTRDCEPWGVYVGVPARKVEDRGAEAEARVSAVWVPRQSSRPVVQE